MSIESQGISNKLPILAVIFVAVLLLGFILMPSPGLQFKLSPEETLTELKKYEHTIGPELLVQIYYGQDSLYRFIDLRTPPEYLKGHLQGAINVPTHKILHEEYRELLNQDEKINVLYSVDHAEACAAWLLLKQAGFNNNMLLMGGYDYAMKHVVNDFSPLSGQYTDEQLKYDINAIVNSSAGEVATDEAEDESVPLPVPKKQTKQVEGGGC